MAYVSPNKEKQNWQVVFKLIETIQDVQECPGEYKAAHEGSRIFNRSKIQIDILFSHLKP